MHPSVQEAFWPFSRPLEGYVDHLYCDVLGLVTCGMGNLVDPLPAALPLPWLHRGTDAPASQAEIAAEWHAVKDGRIPAYRGPRPLYLKAESVAALVGARLVHNEMYLARRWANWADWPADGQLGAHSIAWAAGAGWRAPHFDAAVAVLNFAACAGLPGDAGRDPTRRGEAWLRDEDEHVVFNPGLRPRNLANKGLFSNAAAVVAGGLPRDILHWPGSL